MRAKIGAEWGAGEAFLLAGGRTARPMAKYIDRSPRSAACSDKLSGVQSARIAVIEKRDARIAQRRRAELVLAAAERAGDARMTDTEIDAR